MKRPQRRNLIKLCKKWVKLRDRIQPDAMELMAMKPTIEKASAVYDAIQKDVWNSGEMKSINQYGVHLVKYGESLEDIKDALWEGFNGLIEAETCIKNIAHFAGVEYETDMEEFTSKCVFKAA